MDIVSTKDGTGKAIQRAHTRRRRRNICLAVIAGIIGVALLFLILGFTVFKAKRPVTTVDSFSLKDLQLSLDIPRVRVHLNLTLHVDLSVKNPNRVGFRYANSSALLNYRGDLVGVASIPAGKISADETVGMNLTLTVLADRLLSNSDLYSDVVSGELPLTTHTRIRGRISVLNLFKIRVVSYTTCNLIINVSSRTVGNSECTYKTKL